ncbi:MAG: hypothetical protein GYA15_15220 [Leptolinea sp.]|nr:hypothetical protein [Leptolinea sp.]
MLFSEYWVFWIAAGSLLGFLVFYLLFRKQFISTRNKDIQQKYQLKNVKLYASLIVLFVIAVVSWFVNYIGKAESWNPIIGEIATAIFGVATAGLLGGVIFEFFLRSDILNETSEVLAEIVTTDKKVVREVFTTEKRNDIIKTMMQLNTGNDVYGNALYDDFIARYTDETLGYKKEFRYNFEDTITFFDIENDSNSELANDYFEVSDRIRFQTYLSEYINRQNLIFACAEKEQCLYDFFVDRDCLYRWLFKSPAFKEVLQDAHAFKVNFSIDNHEIQPLEKKMTKRGYEIIFPNPLYSEHPADSLSSDRLIELEFETRTLHPKINGFLSVHLAYPVKGAEICFDFENARSIINVSRLHFLTAGKITPRIEDGVISQFSSNKSRRELKVKISNDHWLFPDSGVIFVWDLAK